MAAIHQSEAVMSHMDDWNTRQHGSSGLTQRVRDSSYQVRPRQSRLTLAFLRKHVVGEKFSDLR